MLAGIDQRAIGNGLLAHQFAIQRHRIALEAEVGLEGEVDLIGITSGDQVFYPIKGRRIARLVPARGDVQRNAGGMAGNSGEALLDLGRAQALRGPIKPEPEQGRVIGQVRREPLLEGKARLVGQIAGGVQACRVGRLELAQRGLDFSAIARDKHPLWCGEPQVLAMRIERIVKQHCAGGEHGRCSRQF